MAKEDEEKSWEPEQTARFKSANTDTEFKTIDILSVEDKLPCQNT